MALDVPFSAIEAGIASARRTCPAGSRWCPIAGDEVRVVVDYAHTDDALQEPARDRAAAGARAGSSPCSAAAAIATAPSAR